MIPLKRLFLVAGFEGHDLERKVSLVRRRFEDGTVRFLARPYPAKADQRTSHLRSLVRTANDVIFGGNEATNFCRRQDQPCAIDAVNSRDKWKTCDRSKSQAACARARPQMIIVVCADRIFDEVLERLGRSTLIMRLPGPELPCDDVLYDQILAFEPIAASVALSVSNRAKSLYSPLVPDRNFQRLGAHPITHEIQGNPSQFVSILNAYHRKLYRADFSNPAKPKIRGAYMLDDVTAFQEDRLHSVTQVIGRESRIDGFHLLNAYHVYGAKVDPGFHFDVMNVSGGAIGHILTDVLTGKSVGGAETHLNATPCDRLL